MSYNSGTLLHNSPFISTSSISNNLHKYCPSHEYGSSYQINDKNYYNDYTLSNSSYLSNNYKAK